MVQGRRASGRPPGAARRAATACLAAAIAVAAFPPAPAAAASTQLRRVGTLPVGDAAGVAADARTGRLLAVSGGFDALAVSAFDARTLKQVAHTSIPGLWPQAGREGRPRVQAFDEQNRRLYVLAFASPAARDAFVDPFLVTIDADRLTLVSSQPFSGVLGPGVRILGLRVRPGARAIVVGQTVAAATAFDAPRAAGVLVAEADLATARATSGPHAVRGCQAAITNRTQSDPGVLGRSVFVGCATTQALAVPGPGVPAIAEVDLDETAKQILHFLPGSYATGDVFFDEHARRLLPVSAAANRPAQSMWVFDLEHRSFVGQIAAGDRNLLGAGVNPANGRVYVGINDALLVSIDRGFEVPQATAFDLSVANGIIAALPYGNRIMIPVEGPDATIEYGVFEDPLGPDAFVPGTRDDPQALDALITEEPQYASDAQAFGARVRQLGGVNAALQNVAPLGGDYWRDPGSLTGLKDGNRDITVASVQRAHLADGESSAEAVSADPDANTASDYLTLTGATGSASGEWPYRAASCRDFGGGAPAAEPVRGASATCRFGQSVAASTTFDAGDGTVPPGSVSVGWATSHVEIRNTSDGIVAVATAEARDVVLGDGVVIGRVFSEATARATGLAGGAAAGYRRVFENVEAGGFTCKETCDPGAVLVALTTALGSQVVVEMPAHESVATPGGAHARATREPWAHQQDVAVTSQDPTQQQVPALRIQYVNDSTLASRVIVDLAATKVDATRIRLVPARPLPPEPEPTPLPPLPPPPPTVGPTVQTPGAQPTPAPIARLVRTVGHGWKVLATGRPGALARSVALWLLLVSPAFFALRRRFLGRLPGAS